jgi:hypothetical protein
MSHATLPSAVPGSIVRKLHLVRSWKRWVQLGTAVLLALVVLLSAMGVAMLVDWLATLYDSRWRFVLTNAALVAAAVTGLGWLLLAWRRGLTWSRVAGDVDREFPELEERWTTMTRLAPETAADAKLVHPAMFRRVASEAVRWEPHVDPQEIVSLSPLVRMMLCLTAITVVLGIAVLLDARQTLVLVRRFWSPGSSISATELVNVPGSTVIGRGEPLLLEANINGRPVDRATLFLTTGDEDSAAREERKITLVAHGKDPIAFSHNVRSVDEAFAYRFRAGDGQTEWFQVNVADRPEIEKLRMTVTPPAYTRREAKSFDRLPRRVSVMAGSTLELAMLPKIPVERVELVAGSKQVAVLTAGEGGWYRWTMELKKDVSFAPLLTESHGLVNRQSPRCEIQVVPDKPPAVKVLTPDDQMAVRPGDTVDITFAAQDDVGIGSAELVVYGANDENGQPTILETIPVDLGEQVGERTVQGQVELDLAKYQVADGAELSYQVRVREDRGPQEGAVGVPVAAGTQPSAETSAATNPQNSQVADGTGQAAADPTAMQPTAMDPTAANAASSNEAAKDAPGTPSTPNAAQTASTAAQSAGNPAAGESTKPDGQSTASAAASSESSPSSQMAKTEAAKDADAANSSAAVPPSAGAPKPGDLAQAGAPKNATPPQPAAAPTLAPTTAPMPGMPTPPSMPLPGMPKVGMPGAEKLAALAKSGATPTNGMKPPAGAGGKQPGKPGRTAESDRRGLMSGMPEDMAQQPESAPGNAGDPSQMAKNDAAQQGGSQPGNSQKSGSAPNKQSANQAAAGKPSSGKPSDGKPSNGQQSSGQQDMAQKSQGKPSGGDPPPGDSMPRRMLDVEGQQASSDRMKLKVDQWAGSFSGQQRQKLELSIGPKLAALDETLAKAERTAQGVIDVMGGGEEWRATHDRDVASAERATEAGQSIITDLEKQTKETPYAFIGLQLADVGLAHVEPARSGFWTALQSNGDSRVVNVRDAKQHVTRARQLVAELRGQFERSKQEFQLAESVERVKKMYQVFVENSMALLPTSPEEANRYKRKMEQFELSDEYLKRLQEVVKMREELRAELARILADDPRLLRRLMDSIRNRSENLRNELGVLTVDQKEFNREVRAWSETDEADRPRIAHLLLMRQLRKSTAIAVSTGELQDRYKAWVPLNRKSEEGGLATATKAVQDLAAGASQLAEHSQQYITDATAPKLAGEGADAKPQAAEGAPAVPTVDSMVAEGQRVYELAVQAETTLQQLAVSEADAEVASFATNRLLDAREIIASTSAWVRQIRAHQAGKYSRAAEVEQYRLAMKTEELAGKLGSLEQTLAGLMQRQDGSLPEPIAVKAREFMATLDNEASPNQLAAVYALHVDDMPRATERQVLAGGALEKSEKIYDEMVKLAIEEMDKLPVQDPVSQLLEDPTLDELLAQLEQERAIERLLGIPPRPTNLRIVNDWMRPNAQLATAMRSMSMMQQQMNRQNQQMRRQLDQAYRRAVARALKESASRTKIAVPKRTKLSDWNRLVSELNDDVGQGRDKTPPEQYRRAIEQYFAQISRAVAEEEKTEE